MARNKIFRGFARPRDLLSFAAERMRKRQLHAWKINLIKRTNPNWHRPPHWLRLCAQDKPWNKPRGRHHAAAHSSTGHVTRRQAVPGFGTGSRLPVTIDIGVALHCDDTGPRGL